MAESKGQSAGRRTALFSNYLIEVDESFREMAALNEIYNEVINSKQEHSKDFSRRKDEAKFARERMLKLSLHVKHLVKRLEAHETLR